MIIDKINNKVKRAPKGTLFILADFSNLEAPYNTIKDAVRKLVETEKLRIIYRGIYQKPNYSKTLQRMVPALPSEIAETYARKNDWRIIPAGETALNQLGLTTQVPNSYEYRSNGPSREIILKNGKKIKFRSTVSRDINMIYTSALVIEAFKALGENNVNSENLSIIKRKLTIDQFEQLKKDVLLSRNWIKDLVIKMEAS
ncbi:DUF6088 family protein [Latilactobacillus fuchuensis]|jgi:hypothetical protein|nr:DUF6088 family protein [Latilactobacillus fuchuensis]MCP8858168.1 DUF6088 family protein [Latilactobacillus fuchuensis]